MAALQPLLAEMPFWPKGALKLSRTALFAGLQQPNPLLYRSFPLTCARSQE
jgi:hypothetical protein